MEDGETLQYESERIIKGRTGILNRILPIINFSNLRTDVFANKSKSDTSKDTKITAIENGLLELEHEALMVPNGYSLSELVQLGRLALFKVNFQQTLFAKTELTIQTVEETDLLLSKKSTPLKGKAVQVTSTFQDLNTIFAVIENLSYVTQAYNKLASIEDDKELRQQINEYST